MLNYKYIDGYLNKFIVNTVINLNIMKLLKKQTF
jgi:hypothetical protein